MYTITVNDLTYTGPIFEVTRNYLDLFHMLGGEDGWAYIIKVTDPHGQPFDMQAWVEGARRLVG